MTPCRTRPRPTPRNPRAVGPGRLFGVYNTSAMSTTQTPRPPRRRRVEPDAATPTRQPRHGSVADDPPGGVGWMRFLFALVLSLAVGGLVAWLTWLLAADAPSPLPRR